MDPENPFESNRDRQAAAVAQGLNSNEIRGNKDIPYADECMDMESVDTAGSMERLGGPSRPQRARDGGKGPDLQRAQIHAADIGQVHQSPNSDTIVVDTPEGVLYITLDAEAHRSKAASSSSPESSSHAGHTSTSPGNTSADATTLSASQAYDAADSSVLIEREQGMEQEQRALGLRRNSVSMPTLQTLELEVLRQQRLQPTGGQCVREQVQLNLSDSKTLATMAEPQKRVRKKPDLRIQIPSYASDYVPMPPLVKQRYLEATGTPKDTPYIDYDGEGPLRATFQIGSPSSLKSPEEIRSSTPVIRIIEPEDEVAPDETAEQRNVENETNDQPLKVEDDKVQAISMEHKKTSVNEQQPRDEEVKVQNEGKSALEEPEEEKVVIRNPLRRSSISVPDSLRDLETLQNHYNDLVNIPEHHQSSGSAFSDGDQTADDDKSQDEERAKAPLRSPLRSPRRAPRRLGRSEFSMDDDDYSPGNSVTSVNSLASLLREKLQSIPQKIRKKPTDFKLRAFVGLMFLAVCFFVGFAYVLYHRQALTRSYFHTVQFNEPKRLVRLLNRDDQEILRARLGVDMGSKQKAFPCLPEHRRGDGSECLEWLDSQRLYLRSLEHEPGVDNTTCYSVHWKALRPDLTPTDCFDWSDTKAHWYGGGQGGNLSWPMDAGSIDYTPFVTGDMAKSQWGNVLTRYFINSKGAAIIIDDETPLYVSVNAAKKEICLRAKHDGFAYANKLTEFPELRYNICTSKDMKSLHASIHSHQRAPLWDGLKPADMQTLESLISEPVWQIAPRFKHELQAETISRYTEDVIDLGFLKQGHVLINEFWQNEIGDLTVDTSRFATLNTTVDKLHRRGFKVVFTVQPFISTESENFADCVQKRLLVTERNSDRRIPALTRFKSLASAGVLDITNSRSVPWILEKLQSVRDIYHIDSFYLDLGTAYNMPHYYQCEKTLTNPDQYKTHFVKTFEKLLSIIGVSSAVSLPRPPIFVSLPPFESSWEALRRVIPTMLTYGISGYPFVMPGAVGGDIYWPGSEQFLPSAKGTLEANMTNSTQENGIALPERELYMRWLQMATFLPVMKFTHLPSKYNDDKVLEMAKNLTVFRQKVVTPLLLKYKREALEEGLPLIRPLWLVSGGDAALLVRDEFALGDEIVVAPILQQGQTTREVYLPAGLWQDGIDGSLRKGSRWMHDYKVPLDRVAYFLRRPDDMRFK